MDVLSGTELSDTPAGSLGSFLAAQTQQGAADTSAHRATGQSPAAPVCMPWPFSLLTDLNDRNAVYRRDLTC